MPDSGQADNENANDQEARDDARAGVAIRWTARACGIGQLALGLVAMIGLVAFLREPADEPLRYQYLMAPILIWMVSVTILFASVLVISRSKTELALFDQLLFQLGSAVPTIAMLGVLLTPAIG